MDEDHTFSKPSIQAGLLKRSPFCPFETCCFFHQHKGKPPNKQCNVQVFFMHPDPCQATQLLALSPCFAQQMGRDFSTSGVPSSGYAEAFRRSLTSFTMSPGPQKTHRGTLRRTKRPWGDMIPRNLGVMRKIGRYDCDTKGIHGGG